MSLRFMNMSRHTFLFVNKVIKSERARHLNIVAHLQSLVIPFYDVYIFFSTLVRF